MPGGPPEGRPAAARLTPPDLRLSSADFRALYQRVRALAPWGADDRRGALNYLTPQRIAAAASSVRDGRTVSLAAPVEGEAADQLLRQACEKLLANTIVEDFVIEHD